VLAEHPDRVVVGLDGLTPADGTALLAIADAESVGAVEPVLRVGGRLRRADGADGGADGDDGFEVLIEALDLDNEVWTPGVVEGDLHADGIVISRVAADDLGVGAGDTVVLVHPAITAAGFVLREDEVAVAAVNASPYRFGVYVDSSLLAAFGAEGLANQAYVLPAVGYTPEDVQRALFFLPGVTSVQPVATASEVLRDTMKQFTGIFRVLEGFILLLALLIAYNSTSINADERARERATLFAIGMSRRRVIVLEMAEGLMYGLLGTAAGLAVGHLVVRWIVTSVVSSTMPEMGMEAVMSGTTVLTAVVMGVVAVAVAPLLTVRRLRRMDVPGTLRVVE
jgi:putative ABC transport system permease protein